MLKQAWANIKNKTEERESWLVGGRGAGQPVGYSQSRATNLKCEILIPQLEESSSNNNGDDSENVT